MHDIPPVLKEGLLSENLRCTFRIYKDDDKMVCITIGDKDTWQTGVRGEDLRQAVDRFHRIMTRMLSSLDG